jgi:hypothetical protein
MQWVGELLFMLAGYPCEAEPGSPVVARQHEPGPLIGHAGCRFTHPVLV